LSRPLAEVVAVVVLLLSMQRRIPALAVVAAQHLSGFMMLLT